MARLASYMLSVIRIWFNSLSLYSINIHLTNLKWLKLLNISSLYIENFKCLVFNLISSDCTWCNAKKSPFCMKKHHYAIYSSKSCIGFIMKLKNLVQSSPVYCLRHLSFKAINEIHAVWQKQSKIHCHINTYMLIFAVRLNER